ncbi:MAG: FAD-dependent oxidoreductase [Burkholderiales bacterium]|nr:FAD-dependent oxidoreductase [Burkholderiales bacterium]
MTAQDCDVLIVGGGIGGCVAALAAARAGARTVLVERLGFLGGSATAAAVGQFVGWETAAGRRVVAGIAEEIVAALVARDASPGHAHFVMSTGHRMDRVSYDPEVLKLVLDELLGAAGVAVLFHATFAGLAMRGATIARADVLARGRTLTFAPRVAVDASGDLELLAAAGARFLPLEEGEVLQPATTMFRFGPIDYAAFDAIPAATLRALCAEGVAAGALPRAALHQSRAPGTDDGWFNVGRVAVDSTDPFALSRAEADGRRQAFAAAAFIRARVPGCAGGRLTALAPQLGIRESRRVAGLHVLTADEVRAGTACADAIAAGAYPIDIHPAQGAGLRFETLGEDHAYAIPLRCLIPAGLDNAFVAGRGISATHTAHAATRVMPGTMAIAQAAGTAAAWQARHGGSAAQVPAAAVRAALVDAGAIVP